MVSLFFPCLLPASRPLISNTASASASCPWLTNHFLASLCKSRNVWLPAIIIHMANSGFFAGCPTCHCFLAIRKSCTCFTSRVCRTVSDCCRKTEYNRPQVIFSILHLTCSPRADHDDLPVTRKNWLLNWYLDYTPDQCNPGSQFVDGCQDMGIMNFACSRFVTFR